MDKQLIYDFLQAPMIKDAFADLTEQAFLTVKPFNDYFKQAIEFEMA